MEKFKLLQKASHNPTANDYIFLDSFSLQSITQHSLWKKACQILPYYFGRNIHYSTRFTLMPWGPPKRKSSCKGFSMFSFFKKFVKWLAFAVEHKVSQLKPSRVFQAMFKYLMIWTKKVLNVQYEKCAAFLAWEIIM